MWLTTRARNSRTSTVSLPAVGAVHQCNAEVAGEYLGGGVMPKVRPASTDSPKLNAMTVPSRLRFQEKACGPLTVETR